MWVVWVGVGYRRFGGSWVREDIISPPRPPPFAYGRNSLLVVPAVPLQHLHPKRPYTPFSPQHPTHPSRTPNIISVSSAPCKFGAYTASQSHRRGSRQTRKPLHRGINKVNAAPDRPAPLEPKVGPVPLLRAAPSSSSFRTTLDAAFIATRKAATYFGSWICERCLSSQPYIYPRRKDPVWHPQAPRKAGFHTSLTP